MSLQCNSATLSMHWRPYGQRIRCFVCLMIRKEKRRKRRRRRGGEGGGKRQERRRDDDLSDADAIKRKILSVKQVSLLTIPSVFHHICVMLHTPTPKHTKFLEPLAPHFLEPNVLDSQSRPS